MAAAAYRAGERLHDERQDRTHDYRNRAGVEHKLILVPDDAPIWVRGIDRGELWNRVEAGEKRKDSQTARELRITIPRELDPAARIQVVSEYLRKSFVSKGMVADVCWHNGVASDGGQQPHAHVLLTMRPLTDDGFGRKSRHDWIADPSGRTHPDGTPVLVMTDRDSWNSPVYFEQCREDWENVANAALARAGVDQQIDRRSLLARGIARLPEPALRLAYHLHDLYGVMKERFGQYQFARHYRAVEEAAKKAFAKVEHAPGGAEAVKTTNRFFGWFDRQAERLEPARAGRAPDPQHNHSMER